MKRLILVCAVLMASTPASAQQRDDRWYWFYAHMGGEVYDHVTPAYVNSRQGRATVRISGSQIAIEFDEPALPEDRPAFKGHISKKGVIDGSLPDFFGGDAPGPGRLIGQYRKGSSPACWEEGIDLREPSPSPAVWILYRAHGNCMANGRDDDEPPMGR